MIVGIGSDLVKIARIEQGMARFGDRFLEKLFTPAEILHCQTKARPAACFAKRFAAKEALAKAMGCGFRQGIWFLDMEVKNDEQGAPEMVVTGGAHAYLSRWPGRVIHLSLSDEEEFALAFVVIDSP
ncbi:MAG: holo-ACP synthase [Magnetococcales bacterium]|nr:holo-ACP synthase [Magnetococcales bacterium]NGZ26164.1 holo-ACP synthase [Magnetococcales bacterium]